MLTIKDTLGRPFDLYAQFCTDVTELWAYKVDVSNALRRKSKRGLKNLTLYYQNSDPFCNVRASITGRFVNLGCHSFTGVNKRALLKWAGRKA